MVVHRQDGIIVGCSSSLNQDGIIVGCLSSLNQDGIIVGCSSSGWDYCWLFIVTSDIYQLS
jgi:hypothetical protein